MAVNVQSEDVKNLTFTHGFLGSRRHTVGTMVQECAHLAPWSKYTGMDYHTRSAASYGYYVVFSGRCTISSIQSGYRSNDQTLFIRRIALRPPPPPLVMPASHH